MLFLSSRPLSKFLTTYNITRGSSAAFAIVKLVCRCSLDESYTNEVHHIVLL
jgi:hypothetical protein